MIATVISNEAEDWKDGHSLPQHYYLSEEIFRRDIRLLGEGMWQLVDHESRIPKPGDFFLFEFGKESVVIARDRSGMVRAHYNVCRHRGSRVCLKAEGNARTFVCPYHAWTYDLDGSLRAANDMPENFDRSARGLIPCHVGVFEGLIFVNLSRGEAPDFHRFTETFRGHLAPYALGTTKVAARRVLPNAANWKLVVENFFECYHCKPAHPTYCLVHDEKKLLAFGAGPGSGEKFVKDYEPIYKAWLLEANKNRPIPENLSQGPESEFFQSGGMLPIGRGNLTESIDGKAVAPLLASFTEYDGAQTGCVFNPVSTVLATSDHAVIFRFTPRGPVDTTAEAIWLVRDDATEGKDYDVGRLIRLWEVTLAEDKQITQDNQLGVMSDVYCPGPYSLHEQRIADFGRWYMRRLAEFA